MSAITDILKRYVKVAKDKLPSTIITTCKTTIANFLAEARVLLQESGLKSQAFYTAVTCNSNLIAENSLNVTAVVDETLVAVDQELPSPQAIRRAVGGAKSVAVPESDVSVYQALTELLNKTGVPHEDSEDPFVGYISMVITDSNGVPYEVGKLNDDEESPIQWLCPQVAVPFAVDFAFYQEEGESLNNIAYDTAGVTHSLWDLVSGLGENAALSTALGDLTDAISGVETDATAVTSLVTSWLNSNWGAVRNLGSQVSSSYAKNGLFGAVYVIRQYVSACANMASEDGHLKFAENSNLVPQSYISGIVSQVFQAIGNVLTAIVSAFSRVLTLIASAVTSIVGLFVTKVGYDYTAETCASIYDGWDTGIPLFPHGFCSTFTSASSHPESFKFGECCAGAGTMYLPVPGGYILFTYSQDGKLAQEFHPDLVDRTIFFEDGALVGSLLSFKEYGTRDSSNWHASTYLPGPKQFLDIISEYDGSSELSVENDALSGVLSVSQSTRLANIGLANTALFYLWLISLHLYHDDNPAPGETKRISFFANGLGGVSAAISWASESHEEDNTYANASAVSNGSPLGWLCHVIFACCWAANDPTSSINTADATHEWKWSALSNFAASSTGRTDPSGSGMVADRIDANWGVDSFNVIRGLIAGRILGGNGTEQALAYAQPYQAPTSFKYAVQTPKYKRSTFWAAVGAAIAIAATTVVVGVACAIGVKIAASKAYSKWVAKAEDDWSKCTKNPSDENLKAYRKSARMTNLYAKLSGNSTISKRGYWSSSADSSSGVETVTSGFVADAMASNTTDSVPMESNGTMLENIKILIQGVIPPSNPGNGDDSEPIADIQDKKRFSRFTKFFHYYKIISK